MTGLYSSAAGGVACSIGTGSDAGKVSISASSSASSWCRRALGEFVIAFMSFAFRIEIQSISPTGRKGSLV
jgi:hypothetical protein